MTPPPTDLPDITSPSTFAARAQAWVLWLNTFYTELAAIIGLTIPAGSAAAGTLTGDTIAANVVKWAGALEVTGAPSGSILPPVYDRVVRTAGDITTTSTSLVDVTGATVAFTTKARPVSVGCAMSSYNSVIGGRNSFNIMVDAALELGTSGITMVGNVANDENMSFSHQTAALTAASHTIKMQWKVSANTGTITANAGNAFSYWAHEL